LPSAGDEGHNQEVRSWVPKTPSGRVSECFDRAHAQSVGCSLQLQGSVGNGSGRCEKVQKRYRSLYSSGLSIYRMTRPHWPLRHRADSGPGLSGFPILPLREYPAHTKVKDRESKSRRTKESKKERLSTKVRPSTSQKETDSASSGMLPKKKQKLTAPGPCSDPCNPNPAQRHFCDNRPRSTAMNE